MKNVPGGKRNYLTAINVFKLKTLSALAFWAVAITSARADSFTSVGSMNVARWYHVATLLQNGQVLVVGNDISAELYNPVTGKWTSTASRTYHGTEGTPILLPNGIVMLAGGGMGTGAPGDQVELYNPVSGQWQVGPSMPTPREAHTVTRLLNGKILLAGGGDMNGPLLVCSLYDPATGLWTNTGALNNVREGHSATLLSDGRVLVAGGDAGAAGPDGFELYTNTAEIYDPATGLWTPTGSMASSREFFNSVLLPNGKVMVLDGAINADALPELYDPTSGTWSPTPPMIDPRWGPSVTLLPNGTVLVAGGADENSFSTNAEIYDPAANTWTEAAPLNVVRYNQTATLLPSGQVLMAGGAGLGWNNLSSAEAYDPGINPSTGTWTDTAQPASFSFDRATLLPDGRALVAGEAQTIISQSPFPTNFAIYDSTTGAWSNTAAPLSPCYLFTENLLPNGKVLKAGGTGYGAFPQSIQSTAELYDPAVGQWTMASSMNVGRTEHTATLLVNGKVLVVGGLDTNGNYQASAELYDPQRGTWVPTGAMNIARADHTATLLPGGKVLVAGGAEDDTEISSELYDPISGKWTFTGEMHSHHELHTATLLPNGQVLVAGGGNSDTAEAELYNPAIATWTITGSMNVGRLDHAACLLPDGKVLVAGGMTNFFNGMTATAEVYDFVSGKWTPTASSSGGNYGLSMLLLPNDKVLATAFGAGNRIYDPGVGFSNAWQPQITSVTSPLVIGGNITVNGSEFSQINGNFTSFDGQDSPTDYPLVQLRSIESGQTTFLLATNWSANSFTSLPVTNFPPGYALATVFASGIPSTSSVVNISVPVPTSPILTATGATAGGAFQFGFTNAPGALFGAWASTNAATPLANWIALGAVTEVSPGVFQFSDGSATNGGQKFYSVRSP